MKIVIDIPDQMYERVLDGTYCGTLYEELKNGTPLPKGQWKEIYAESDGSNSWIEFKCPHCGGHFGIESGQYGWHYTDPIPWKACPMCGTIIEADGGAE